MNARLPIIAVVAALLSACGYFPVPWPDGSDGGAFVPLCTNDNECAANQVCYVDGCGDPGENLAVEVVPQSGTGEAQDFTIGPGQLRPEQILDLFPAAKLSGGIYRNTVSGPQPYEGAVSISIRGESAVIPGLVRRYATTSPGQTSTYSAQIGAGYYTVIARADNDPGLPPVILYGIFISPGQSMELPIVFAGDLELVRLSGKIVQTADRLEPVQASLDVQVMDLETREQLSQRVAVSATGEFSVAFTYPRTYTAAVLLQVTPRDATAMVPRRSFTVPVTTEALEQPLEFGDYGGAVPVNGRVVDLEGNPVELARVSLSGQVVGGGTFQTASVSTASDGTFTLQTLAGDPAVPMRLSIVPPVRSEAAITIKDAVVPYTGGDIGDFVTSQRIVVDGQVLRPDGVSLAGGVKVVATPAGPLGEFPLPSATVETQTDSSGRFELLLDPALYRLDLSPGESLPGVSRYAAISPNPDDHGVPAPVILPSFILSSGRTVTGLVTIREPDQGPDAGTSVPAVNATVRFFRITPVNGTPGALLLAEGVSGSGGEFQVILPTR